MELYHDKLDRYRRELANFFNFNRNVHINAAAEDIGQIAVFRAYLPANLVAQAQSNISAQREKDQGK